MAKRGKKGSTTKKNTIVKPLSVRSKNSEISKSSKKDENFSPRSMRNRKIPKYDDFRPRSVCCSPKRINNLIKETNQIKTRTQTKKCKNILIRKNKNNNKGKNNIKNNKGKNKNKIKNRNNNKQKKEENEEIEFEEIDIIETDEKSKNNKDNNDLFSKEMIKDLKIYLSQTINDSLKNLTEEQKKFFEEIRNEQQQFFVKTNESILNVLSLHSNTNNSISNEIKKEKLVNNQI